MIADDAGLLLLDIKDLRAMLQFAGENAKQFTTDYGNISAASIGAIQRGLLQIEGQGADKFFGEPMLDIGDFMQTIDGHWLIVHDHTSLSPTPATTTRPGLEVSTENR